MAHPQTVYAIIENWIKKGDSEDDVFNKFISYWIAFNCYYSSDTGEENDRNAIEILKKDDRIIAFYNGIKKDTIIINFEKIFPVKNVQKNKSFSANRNDFSSIVEGLYQIRNNLFHGNKSGDIQRDKDVVSAAVPVLKKLVKYCKDNFWNLNL